MTPMRVCWVVCALALCKREIWVRTLQPLRRATSLAPFLSGTTSLSTYCVLQFGRQRYRTGKANATGPTGGANPMWLSARDSADGVDSELGNRRGEVCFEMLDSSMSNHDL